MIISIAILYLLFKKILRLVQIFYDTALLSFDITASVIDLFPPNDSHVCISVALLLPALVYDSLSASRIYLSKSRLINERVLCTPARTSEGCARVASNYSQPRACIIGRTSAKRVIPTLGR